MTAPVRPPRAPAEHVEASRAEALAMLDAFRSSAMPSFLRRLRIWKGLDPVRHADVVEDLEQELRLDCVENAAAIVELPRAARHRRWMKLAQHHHYRLRIRATRRTDPVEEVDSHVTCAPSAIELDLPPDDAELLDRVAANAALLRNGRLCLRSTARAAGVGRDRLRQLWTDVAAALGLDRDHLAFWRRRLAEALCMIAAARLRHCGLLRLWDDARRRDFDRAAFRRRLDRIRDALAGRPIDPGLRVVVERIAPRGDGRLGILDPRELLAIAEGVAPEDPAIPAWRFEAELLADDLREAARCLIRARRLDPDRARIVLARARLLEARGRACAARALLCRALGRHGPDARLAASLDALGGAPRRYAPSRARMASTSSLSQRA